jgi:hypothetical protein
MPSSRCVWSPDVPEPEVESRIGHAIEELPPRPIIGGASICTTTAMDDETTFILPDEDPGDLLDVCIHVPRVGVDITLENSARIG